MARQARIDPPGALQHLMARGVNSCTIFHDDEDREQFLRRAVAIFAQSGLQVLAWCLMGTHFHFYGRAGPCGVGRPMHRLLSSYVGYFNARHGRHGHLLGDRFTNVVVASRGHHLELLRYIPLNPLHGGIVQDLDALREYRWSSHPAMLGIARPRLVDLDAALASFAGGGRETAAARYELWVAKGARRSREHTERRLERLEALARAACEDQGGAPLAAGLEPQAEFVAVRAHPDADLTLHDLAGIVCRASGIPRDDLVSGCRMPSVVQTRDDIAYLAGVLLGSSGPEIARHLRMSDSAACRARARAQERWERGERPALPEELLDLLPPRVRLQGGRLDGSDRLGGSR